MVVTRVRPVGPAGQRPSTSCPAERSSSTTSHGLLVSLSQLTNLAATASASPAGSVPMATAATLAYADKIDTRLDALTQTSKSMSRACHSDSANWAAT